MVKKSVFAVSFLLLCMISISLVTIEGGTWNEDVPSLLKAEAPNGLYVHDEKKNQEIIFEEEDIIKELHSVMMDKKVGRISAKEYKEAKEKNIITMDYGYKGKSTFLDRDGRIFISVDKGEIRNRSRMHWLWWKMDSFFREDSKNHIYYKSEPDAHVLRIAYQIRDILKRN